MVTPQSPKKRLWNAGTRFLVMIYNRLSESCIKTCVQNNLDGVHGTYILRIFFLKKGGTLKQGAITYSGNEFILWGQVKTCSGDPRVHHGTNQVKSWGGVQVPPCLLPDLMLQPAQRREGR